MNIVKRFLFAVTLVCAPLSGEAIAQTVAAPKTLVVYDYQPDAAYGKLGKVYAIMQRNLLGHFNTQVDMLPVQDYTAGKIADYDALFYIGAYYDNGLIPPAFLDDVYNTDKTVVWFKNNLWKLAWDTNRSFATKFGFTFDGLRGLNGTPSATSPNPGFFDTVHYKGLAMSKYYAFNPTTNVVNADPDIGVTHVLDPALAQAKVDINNSVTGEAVPYVLRAGKFWYVADIPYSYIGPRDRYLAMSDLLFDILGVQDLSPPRAMIRLEDVGANVDPAAMRQLTDMMKTRNIRFSVAVIPRYVDPLGKYNGGVPMDIRFNSAGARDLRESLTYARQRGGAIVMHGYTHQYGSQLNPHSGVSGDDFEFWNIVTNTPVPLDSDKWVRDRLTAGIKDLGTTYAPYSWEVPHYHASPTASRVAPSLFKTAYQRAVYFTHDKGLLTDGEYSAGQFFPYVIQQDYYGQRILPENLGNIEYDISDIDPTSNVVYTADDLLLNAQYALAVRGGFGSFFFHPFWLEPEIGTPGLADFTRLVDGMTNMGYVWVGGDQL